MIYFCQCLENKILNSSYINSAYFILFLIFISTLFYFIILYWFCHTLAWIHHWCTCVPKHEPPSCLPPHNISLGNPRAPAPSMLYPASNICWRFDSYMIVYMFQCHYFKHTKLISFSLICLYELFVRKFFLSQLQIII